MVQLPKRRSRISSKSRMRTFLWRASRDDRVVQLADLVPAAFEDLDEHVVAEAEDPGDAGRGIVRARLLENGVLHRRIEWRGGAARVEKADKHGGLRW